MLVHEFPDGYALQGDCTSDEVIDFVRGTCGPLKLVATDPPYGNLVSEDWDKWDGDQKSFTDWMLGWSNRFSELVVDGGAMYVWGGYGKPGFRPLFEYVSRLESETPWRMSNIITWSKKRAYGVKHNYLQTREDLLYLVKGDIKKPITFNIPLLSEKRGYAGYSPKPGKKTYVCKSEFYRRTNVWMDVTEIMQGKIHPTQKPLRVVEIPIETNTDEGDWVFDPFAGSMTTAWAARRLKRKWVCVERDEEIFWQACEALREGDRKR